MFSTVALVVLCLQACENYPAHFMKGLEAQSRSPAIQRGLITPLSISNQRSLRPTSAAAVSQSGLRGSLRDCPGCCDCPHTTAAGAQTTL